MVFSKFNRLLQLIVLVLFAGVAAALPPTVLAQKAPILVAQSNIRTQRVQFKPDTTSATVQGTIRGYQIVDYLLNARQGQTMNISMATNNDSSYFNILAPGEREVAMFNGSINGNQYEGTLSRSGDYRVRVYLMRSAARRNEVANYRLEMIIGGATNLPGKPVGGDATVPGTNYNATGNIPCSMGGGQPTQSCFFGVTRERNGSGTVTVTKSDGRTRSIFFKNGRAIGYDQSQSDRGRFSASKRGDLTIVQIGQERYEIPDAVIYGG